MYSRVHTEVLVKRWLHHAKKTTNRSEMQGLIGSKVVLYMYLYKLEP